MSAQPTEPTPGLDPAATRRQFDLVFAPHLDAYPSDALITMVDHRRGRRHVHVPLRDARGFVETAQRVGATERVDLCLAPRSSEALWRRAEAENPHPDREPTLDFIRGGTTECYGLAAIPFDVDTPHEARARTDLPSMEEARDILDACPLPLGLVVRSGGGLHGYLLLDRPLDLESGEQGEVLRRAQHWLRTQCEGRGVEPDLGPMTATGSLRVAGVLRGKGGADHFDPTPILRDSGERWSVEDALAAFPPAPEREHAGRGSRGGAFSEGVAFDGDDDRPGTRLAAALPVSRLLVEVFGCEARGSNGWVLPRPDGSVNSSGHHAITREDRDEPTIEVAQIHGTRWLEAWDLDASPAVLSSWDVLGRVACGGDWGLAGRIARIVTMDEDALDERLDELVGLLASGADAEDLAEHYALRPTAPTVTPQGEPVATLPGDSESVEVTLPATEVDLTRDLRAVLEGPDLGLYRLRPVIGADGNPTGHVARDRQPITTWLAVRSAVHIEGDNFDMATFDLRVMTRSGRTVTVSGMTAADSLDPKKVWTAANTRGAGIALPERTDDRAAVANMLALLGQEGMERNRIIRRTGVTVTDDGRHRFLGVRSSIDATGVTTEQVAALPRGASAGNGVAPVLAGIGWADLPTDERAAARSIRALINVAPTRPVVGIAMLGVFAAAVTGCDERTTVILDATTAAAKSQAASCLTPFYSMAPRSASNPPVDLEKDSAAFAFTTMRWHAHLPIWLDDARVNTESARAAEASMALISGLTQAAFSGSSGGRGSGVDVVAATGVVVCPAIMTAERTSTQSAIINRSAVMTLGRGDVEREPTAERPVPGLDAFTRGFADTGLANAMGASFIRWWVRQLDARTEFAPGDLVALPKEGQSEAMAAAAAWAKRRRSEHMMRFGVDRETGSAGYLRMGWDLLFAWADAVGVRDLLPSAEEVDAALGTLVADTRAKVGVADPAVRWLHAVAAFIEGGRGHLVDNVLGAPRDALARGWRETGGGLSPQGTRMGVLSADGRHVVLSVQGLQDAARALDVSLLAYSPVERDRFLRAHCDEALMARDVATGKVSTRLGIPSRPRGFVVPVEALFGDDDPAPADEQPTPTPVTPAPVVPAPVAPVVPAPEPESRPTVVPAPAHREPCGECGATGPCEISCSGSDF